MLGPYYLLQRLTGESEKLIKLSCGFICKRSKIGIYRNSLSILIIARKVWLKT